MSISSVANLVDLLDKHHLLTEEQSLALRSTLQPLYSEPRALARELVRRGWLTPYQVNHIFQDRAAELVVGAYVLAERLGEGGMGMVYKARHARLGRVVALKIIRKDRLQNGEALRRFHRETQAAAQLSHPNVVLAYDADRIGDSHFIAMEYVDGIDLSRLIKAQGPLPVPLACEYIRQAALGLQHAFERGLVHRDIKPGNLLLAREPAKDGSPVVKLLDLGLARANFPDADDANTLTREGEVVGTPDFLAPEQARNAHRADIRADIYSLGCTFFFLLTGRAPFAGGTLTEKLLKHHWDAPPSVESVRPEVSPEISAVIARSLAKRPEDRFQTPAELAQAIDYARRPAPVGAVPVAALPVAPLIAPPTHQAPAFPTAPLLLDPETGELPAVPTGDGILASLPPDTSPAVTPRPAQAPSLRLEQPRHRRRRWWPVAVLLPLLVGGAAAAVVGLFTWRSSPATRPTAASAPTPDFVASPLDKLRSEGIPKLERFPWQPKELVAVLGEHGGRHAGPASCVALSPDGTTLVSAGADHTVRLWAVDTLRETFAYPPFRYDVVSLAISPDGKYLACGDRAGAIRVFPLVPAEARTIFTLEKHEDAVTALAFTADGKGLFSAGEDHAVVLWDLTAYPRRKSRIKAEYGGHADKVTCLAVSRGDTFLVTADESGWARLWDLTTSEPGKPLAWKASDEAVRGVAAAPNGKYVVTAGDEKMLRVWDATTGKAAKPATIDVPANTTSLTFSSDGRLLICGHADGYLTLIEVNRSEAAVRERFRVGTPVLSVAAPARRSESFPIAAGTLTGLVRVWDVKANGLVAARPDPKGHIGGVTGLAFAPDGKHLVSCGYDAALRLWSLPPDGRDRPLGQPGEGGPLAAVAFFPDGKRIAASARWDAWLRVFDLDGVDRGSRPVSQADKAGGGALAFTSDGRFLAFAGQDGEGRGLLRLLDATTPTFRELFQQGGHTDRIAAVVFFDGDHRLATAGGDDRTVRIWDRGKLTLLKRFDQPTTPVTALAASPHDDELASGETGMVRRWDLRGGDYRELTSLATDGGQVTSLTYAPDGGVLAAATDTGRVMVWELSSRKLLQNWSAPFPVNAVAFAPDGRHLAAGNGNGTIYLFRLKAPSIR